MIVKEYEMQGREYMNMECDKCHSTGMTAKEFLAQYKDGFRDDRGWYQRGKKHYCYDCAKKLLVKKGEDDG